jgi:hypothetical protein
MAALIAGRENLHAPEKNLRVEEGPVGQAKKRQRFHPPSHLKKDSAKLRAGDWGAGR